MNLENALKMLSPQSINLINNAKDTSPDKFTTADVIMALSLTSTRSRLGLNALLAKMQGNASDAERAINELMKFIRQYAPETVQKASGCHIDRCMAVLAEYAFYEYCRTPATRIICHDCSGKGMVNPPDTEQTEKPGAKSFPQLCQSCHGKGEIHARCRCGGRGEIQDRKKTRERGVIFYKKCERCAGKGYASLPSTVIYQAVLTILPDLNQRTWSRNWKPFYQSLITHCYIEEEKAKKIFHDVTSQ